jgi:hypothetical protein
MATVGLPVENPPEGSRAALPGYRRTVGTKTIFQMRARGGPPKDDLQKSAWDFISAAFQLWNPLPTYVKYEWTVRTGAPFYAWNSTAEFLRVNMHQWFFAYDIALTWFNLPYEGEL